MKVQLVALLRGKIFVSSGSWSQRATILRPRIGTDFIFKDCLGMGKKTAPKVVTMIRDAKTGRLVSADYAKHHPATTVVEKRKVN